ncbi:hypothetical protein [Parvularcula oceani]|uniref:hypothetical protein n=1 Tax=Parvularcula oceani TaxID=1247963 RepID=UPI0012DE9403|nr:hypothetical protein [Parvularcula oceani]
MSAILLTACATGPQAFDAAEIDRVERGQAAVIAAAFEGNDEFHASWLTLGNLDTSQLYKIYVQDENITAAARTDSAVVSPGQYVVLAAEIYSKSRESDVPMMRYWFAPFEVEGGDVVHLGTIKLDVIDHEALPESLLDQATNLAKRLSTSDRNRYIYPTIADTHDGKIADDLAVRSPQLAGRLEKLELDRRIDPAAFARIIAEAYAPNADGSAPSSEEARAEIDGKMTIMFQTGQDPAAD